jgi:peptide/nickel transport system substrate-binding protein
VAVKRIAATLAVVAASALVLSGCTNPYTSEVVANSEITVAFNEQFDNYNSVSSDGNNVKNGNITYIANSGFSYYDNDPKLVRNTEFGSFEKTSDDPLTVKYTVNSGVTWSDGAPVDTADMLLAWAANSGNVKSDPAFAAASTAGLSLVTEMPTLSDDGKTLTLVYSKPYVDWELAFGIGVSAHGTYAIAFPDEYKDVQSAWDAYGSAADADKASALTKYQDAAKAFAKTADEKVIAAIKDGDSAVLGKLATAWNTGYAFSTLPSNPAQYLSNGPYVISAIGQDQYVTLSANPLYTWGPSPHFEKITVRAIADSTAALQALQNGELDIWQGQPTADILTVAQGIKGANIEQRGQASYEHVDLTFNNGGPFDKASYGGDDAKAKLVREAFLLTIPRQEIIDKIIKPLDPSAEIRNSFLVQPSDKPKYDTIVADNGSAEYATVDIEKAKSLLAEAGVKTPVKVGFWYPEGNVRRGQEFELIAASAALAGFQLEDQSEPNWEFTDPSIQPINSHDAVIFAWSSTSLAISGSDQIFGTYTDPLAKGGNYSGYSNASVDKDLAELELTVNADDQTALQLNIEKQLWADAYGTMIFQFPGLLVSSDKVTGVSDNPLSPNYFWNFWEWTPVTK